MLVDSYKQNNVVCNYRTVRADSKHLVRYVNVKYFPNLVVLGQIDHSHLLSMLLSIFVCRGIPFVSSDREERIKAISLELNSGKYDIVSLQEVWSESDFQRIKENTETILPHVHYFYRQVK